MGRAPMAVAPAPNHKPERMALGHAWADFDPRDAIVGFSNVSESSDDCARLTVEGMGVTSHIEGTPSLRLGSPLVLQHRGGPLSPLRRAQ